MIEMVQAKREELARLCARHHVRRLELFGSASGGGFDSATSDLDFLVEFEEVPLSERADCYFGLLEGMESLFHRAVDLTETQAVHNPYFLAAIESTREVLYAA